MPLAPSTAPQCGWVALVQLASSDLRLRVLCGGVSWLSRGGRSRSHRPTWIPCRLSRGFRVLLLCGRVIRLRWVACVLLRSAWLPGGWGAIARTGRGSSLVSRGVLCRVVGTSRRLRLLRLPTSGTGDGFPRHALLITAGGYCSVSMCEGDVKGGQGATPAPDSSRCPAPVPRDFVALACCTKRVSSSAVSSIKGAGFHAAAHHITLSC